MTERPLAFWDRHARQRIPVHPSELPPHIRDALRQAEMDQRHEHLNELMRDQHTGSSFDSFLEEEGIRDTVEAAAAKRVIEMETNYELVWVGEGRGGVRAWLARLIRRVLGR